MASSSRSFYLPGALYVFFFSAVSCLVPFLNLHARDLGLNTWECSLANLAAAVLSALGALGAFGLNRSCGRPKLLSIPCLVLSALAYTSLIFVPKTIRIPRQPLMEFDCSSGLRIEKCTNWPSCAPCPLSSTNLTSFSLSDCQHVCQDQSNVSDTPHVCFRSGQGNFCEVYDETAKAQNTTIHFRSRFQEWQADYEVQVPVTQFFDDHHDPTGVSTGEVDVCSYKPQGAAPLAVNGRNYEDIFCWSAPEGCRVKCRLNIDVDPDPSHCLQIFGDPVLTFWAYLGIRAVADTFLLSSVVLLEGFFLTSVHDLDGFYGRIRLWPAVGMSLFPLLTGFLVEHLGSAPRAPTDYSPSFFLYDGLILMSCGLILATRLESGWKGQYVVNSPSKRRAFWSPELGVLFVLVLTLGTLWGVLDSLLPALFLEAGCSGLVVGACAGLPFLCALPFVAVAKNLMKNVGRANLLVFAFLFYAIRFAGLSFVVHPLWTLPFQAMQTFSLVVAWLASVSYAHSLVSHSNRPLVHFALYFLHFGAGRAFGVVIGEALEEVAGLPWTFRGLACFCLMEGLFYLLLYHTCIKKRSRKRAPPYPRGTSNGEALFPMTDRRHNGDAVHDKDDSMASLQAARPMMAAQEQEDK